jgi:hypothetical protein
MRYRAAAADQRAWRQSRRPQGCRLATHPALRRAVAMKLARQWSPQQISGWLRRTFPSNPALQVSPEPIYRSLVVQSRGVLKRALVRQSVDSTIVGMRAPALGSVRDPAKSWMPFPFDNGQPKPPIGRYPAIGKAICSKALVVPTSRRSSSVNHATSC